jgi:hypothetical protein
LTENETVNKLGSIEGERAESKSSCIDRGLSLPRHHTQILLAKKAKEPQKGTYMAYFFHKDLWSMVKQQHDDKRPFVKPRGEREPRCVQLERELNILSHLQYSWLGTACILGSIFIAHDILNQIANHNTDVGQSSGIKLVLHNERARPNGDLFSNTSTMGTRSLSIPTR